MNRSKNILNKVWIILISGILFILFFIVSVNYNFLNLFGGMPSLQDLEKPESELSSELYSSDNKLLGKYFRYNRSPVKFNELSDELVTTLLVTEDIRLYEHSGIDLKGLIRASYGVLKNVATFGSSGSLLCSKSLNLAVLFCPRSIPCIDASPSVMWWPVDASTTLSMTSQ